MDASIAALVVGMAGFNPIVTPFLFGLTHFILVGMGNIFALLRIVNRLGEKFVFLLGVILLVIGLLRFF